MSEAAPIPISKAARGRNAAPKWRTDVETRLRNEIRKAAKPLADLVAKDANEGNTRLFVTDFLADALGFDNKVEDLTTEFAVKGEYADYGIRIERERGEKELVAFVEVKRVTTKLSERHLRQVEMYAVNEGVEWVILTNGVHWQIYHLAGGPPSPIQIDPVLDVNLLSDGTIPQKASQLFYITKEALQRKQIEDLWKVKRATSPRSLAQVVLSKPVVDVIRRELWRGTRHKEEPGELVRMLKDSVIRTDCL